MRARGILKKTLEVFKVSAKDFVHLLTPEGEALRGQPWRRYPRPQLRRDSFFCLNGLWDFAALCADEAPETFPEKILVPFAPESLLSGIHRTFPKGVRFFYRTTFTLPDGFRKARVLLHFGAVDQHAEVWLNGARLGAHTGGYDPFTFDVTEHLLPQNTLLVRATDNLDRSLPYGKQRRKRGGMWYTPVSGIWQTVWLESVPQRYIHALKIDTDVHGARIDTGDAAMEGAVTVQAPEGALRFPLREGRAEITLDAPKAWSPESPYLYEFTIEAGEDRVQSYFALRTLETKTIDGVPRLCLNGRPCFFHALLDQGYWSDGLFTPTAPECYARDILAAKRLGFNALRKHVKVEPEQFYYDCDRLGMIVMQDMVNNGGYSFLRDTALPTAGLRRLPDALLHPNRRARRNFYDAMENTVARLRNHPCVCYWTIFNEGWGQFRATAAYRRLRALDPTRFIDSASGWFAGGETDVDSRHVYFRHYRFRPSAKPVVLSEFGGYSLKPAGHAFNAEKTYGYRKFTEQDAYQRALDALYREDVLPAAAKGLCGAVYTQLSDVEDETNGLFSYDRKAAKADEAAMQEIAQALREAVE